jgi:hypothetical protein
MENIELIIPQALYTVSTFTTSTALFNKSPSSLLSFAIKVSNCYWLRLLIPSKFNLAQGLYPTAIYIMVALESSVVEETFLVQTITAACVQPPGGDRNDGVEGPQELESVDNS